MAKVIATQTRSRATEDRPLALAIGARLRAERTRRKLTQAALAGDRYTKAYISALEHGLAKPSMAALNYLAAQLEIPVTKLLAEEPAAWTRLEVDLQLASGDWQAAFDGYTGLLEVDGSPATRAELLRGLAEAAGRLDRGADAVRAGAEAAAIFERAGRPVDAAWARFWEAFGLYELEQSAEARRLLGTLRDQMTTGKVVEPDLGMRVLIALANVESRDGAPEQALGHLEQARALVSDLDDRRRATFLFSLALSYRELGDLEAAVSTANQSLAYFKAAAAELEVASLENELALVHLALDNTGRAREHAATARTAFERLGADRLLAHVAETEAQIELAAGAPTEALERATEALQRARATDNRKAELSALLSLARGHRALGDAAAALVALEDAAALARTHGRRNQLQAVLGEFAQVVAEQGDLKRAFALSQEALAVARVQSPTPARSAEVADVGRARS
jgi:transcriptional regulator with XRE-family HTH domain